TSPPAVPPKAQGWVQRLAGGLWSGGRKEVATTKEKGTDWKKAVNLKKSPASLTPARRRGSHYTTIVSGSTRRPKSRRPPPAPRPPPRLSRRRCPRKPIYTGDLRYLLTFDLHPGTLFVRREKNWAEACGGAGRRADLRGSPWQGRAKTTRKS